MVTLHTNLTEKRAVQERDAALRIQSTFRGHKTRKQHETERKAATVIQRFVRGRLARNETKERIRWQRDHHLYEEARRRRQQRLARREKEKEALKGVDALQLREWEAKRNDTAATTVQSAWRRKQAQTQHRGFANRRLAAAIYIQRMYRRFKARSGRPHRPASAVNQSSTSAVGRSSLEARAAVEITLKMDAARRAELKERVRERVQQLQSLWVAAPPSAEEKQKVTQQCRELLTQHHQMRPVYAARAMAQHRVLESAKTASAREEYWRGKKLVDLTDEKVTDFSIPGGKRLERARQEHAKMLSEARVESRWWRIRHNTHEVDAS